MSLGFVKRCRSRIVVIIDTLPIDDVVCLPKSGSRPWSQTNIMVIAQLTVAFRAIVNVIGLPGNLLVVATVSVARRFHVMRYVLLASLAVSDALTLILTNTYSLNCIIQEKCVYSETMCHLLPFFSRYFYINTVLHLVAVSYEQYRAIVKAPLTYDGTISARKMVYVVLLWIVPIPLSIGPFLGWGTYVYNPKMFVCEQGWSIQSENHFRRLIIFAILSFILPFLFILYMNWSVFKTARRVRQDELVPQHLLKPGESQNEAVARRTSNRKAAVDVCIVVGAFLLCFIPVWILGVFRQTMENTEDVPALASMIANAIFLVSSMVNPIIYSIRKQAFRDAVKKGMRRFGFTCGSNSTNAIGIGADNQVRHPNILPSRASESAAAPTTSAVISDQPGKPSVFLA